jgi:hypothetical protein
LVSLPTSVPADAEQVVQALADEPEKVLAGHGFGAEPAAQNEPAAQGPGVTVPAGQLLPATQATQVVFEPWPVALEDVPAGQRVGALAAGQNEPAGQEPGTAVSVPAGQFTPAAHGVQLLREPDDVHTLNAPWLQENVGVP